MKTRIVGAALAAACLLVAPAIAQGGRFPGQRWNLGAPAFEIALADVDGDGVLDLLAAAGGLRVRRGLGDGSFGPVTTYTTASGVVGLAVGDLDRDGDVDAVISEWSVGALPENVVRFLNNGDGTFGAKLVMPSGANAYELELADLDGDDVLDLVVLLGGSQTGLINVRLGTGTGSFGTFFSYTMPDHVDEIAVADADGDGVPDVLVTSGHLDAVLLLPGAGDGTLGPPVTIAAIPGAHAVATTDLDGDGALDVVVGDDGNPGSVWVVRGLGGGAFAAPVEYPSGYIHVSEVAVGDVDRDGLPDVVGAASSRLCLFRGLGDGTLAPSEQHELGSFGHDGIALGDLERDGALDVVVSNTGAADVTVISGDGLGGLVSAPLVEGPSVFNPAVAIADFDGDGALDVFATNEWDDEGHTFLGDGAGGFALASTMPVPDVTWWGGAALLDGDAIPDLVLIDRTTDTWNVYHGVGDGTFTPGQVLATGGSQPREADLGDLDHDGDVDAVVIDELDGTLLVLLGQGDGTFAPGGPAMPAVFGTLARNVALADVTGDGHLDVLACSWGGTQFWSLLRGQGDGTFGPPIGYLGGEDASEIGAADLDGDGAPEVLIVSYQDQRLTVVRNSGDPQSPFQEEPLAYPTGFTDDGGPARIAVADFDLDGDLDVAVGQGGSQRVDLMLGNGVGGLVAAESYSVDETGNFVYAGDWNADGAPDLLGVAQMITVLVNRTSFPWKVLGWGLPGGDGIPHLHGAGTLHGGQPVTLTLTHARPLAPVTLVVGFDQAHLSFKGGMMVPHPDLLLGGLVTDGVGTLALSGPWPAGVPAGLSLALQAWVVDPTGPVGVAASGAASATAP